MRQDDVLYYSKFILQQEVFCSRNRMCRNMDEEDRSIDRETFKAKIAEYDARIEVLKDKINTIMAPLDEKNEITIDRSAANAKKLTKDLWDKYIESAEVFPNDRIVVKLNFENICLVILASVRYNNVQTHFSCAGIFSMDGGENI